MVFVKYMQMIFTYRMGCYIHMYPTPLSATQYSNKGAIVHADHTVLMSLSTCTTNAPSCHYSPSLQCTALVKLFTSLPERKLMCPIVAAFITIYKIGLCQRICMCILHSLISWFILTDTQNTVVHQSNAKQMTQVRNPYYCIKNKQTKKHCSGHTSWKVLLDFFKHPR